MYNASIADSAHSAPSQNLHNRFRRGMRYSEIVDPYLATVPLPYDLWFMRVLIMDRKRLATDSEIAASMHESRKKKALAGAR